MEQDYDPSVVNSMLQACDAGNAAAVQHICDQNGTLYASQQDAATGTSPLMLAARHGHLPIAQYLLEQGAPWNAVDRNQQCAGNHATTAAHWEIVNALVEWGTRSELILGMVERGQRDHGNNKSSTSTTTTTDDDDCLPVSHQPCTKPDYLRQRLMYSKNGQSLLDADQDAVMMEWERPLMQAHAKVLMERSTDASNTDTNTNTIANKRVLNVGFGMGIVDGALQALRPCHHIIIEAHPDVYQKMLRDGWDKKPGVRICFGTWQDVLPRLIQEEGAVVDAIFYDTYGEHFLDLEDFHKLVPQILAKHPDSVYSFFNGLAPDNLFFHGVACNCVKLQLSQLGLDSEFLPCEIQVKDEVWEGVRRKYWHGRDTYYLPVCKWNAQFLQTGALPPSLALEAAALHHKRKSTQIAAAAVVLQPPVNDYGAKRQQLD